jgi:hypothetical protein
MPKHNATRHMTRGVIVGENLFTVKQTAKSHSLPHPRAAISFFHPAMIFAASAL